MASVSGQYATVNMQVEDAARVMAVDSPSSNGSTSNLKTKSSWWWSIAPR